MLKKPVIQIDGVDYPLATTLRVAYKIQGMNEHKPYSQVFQDLAEMTVEKQIDIVYAAFTCANSEHSSIMDNQQFRDYCFDHMNLKDLMDILQQVVKAILGDDEDTNNSGDVDTKN